MLQIEAQKLTLGYGHKKVVNQVDFKVKCGEFISIIGPSGVGKSTLLMGLNGTTSILGGQLSILGEDLNRISNGALQKLRARIGVIFQGYNLVARMSVLDNIASGMLQRKPLFAAMIKHYSSGEYEEIYEYMKVVGLEQEALSRCDRLSGGQRQRVAIARAVAQKPEIILADEPISSLDPVSARGVMDTLRSANQNYGITVVSNLHQLDYAREYCTRVIGMRDGRIVFDDAPEYINPKIINEVYGDRCQHLPKGTIKKTYLPVAAMAQA
ncbi:MAG: phosphonate ABC transporter ATP-binding protein [Desulfuromonadales bacterium]|nr:phosphonate ABC transporter ATP-binding protein [Desulfuromonadales bacterium]